VFLSSLLQLFYFVCFPSTDTYFDFVATSSTFSDLLILSYVHRISTVLFLLFFFILLSLIQNKSCRTLFSMVMLLLVFFSFLLLFSYSFPRKIIIPYIIKGETSFSSDHALHASDFTILVISKACLFPLLRV